MLARLALPKLGGIATVCVAAAAIGALAGRSPATALGLAAALAFVPVVFTWYTVGAGIFIVSTFLGLSGGAQKGIGALVIVVAIAILALGRRALSANFFSEHRRMTAVLLAFLAWTFLSVTWATSPGDVLYSVSRYVPDFLIFFVVYAAVDDRRDAVVLVAFFALGAAVSATDAILSPPAAAAYTDVSRAGGTFGDPNYLAAVLVTGFVVSVALNRMRSFGVLARLAAGVSAALCIVGILLSVSRGGLIALGVALVAAICVSGRWRLKLGLITVVVGTIGMAYFALFAPAAVRQRLTSSSDGGSGRTTIWRVGWREAQANLLKGVGAGNFSVAGVRYVTRPGVTNHQATSYQAYFVDTPTVAHNTYLELLAEGGVPGISLFLLLIVGSLGCTRRAWLGFRRSRDEDMELISYAVFTGLLGFLAASFFLSEEYSKQLFALLALGPALLKVASPTAPASTSPWPRPTTTGFRRGFAAEVA